MKWEKWRYPKKPKKPGNIKYRRDENGDIDGFLYVDEDGNLWFYYWDQYEKKWCRHKKIEIQVNMNQERRIYQRRNYQMKRKRRSRKIKRLEKKKEARVLLLQERKI